MADEQEAMWLHSRGELSIVELAQLSGLAEPMLRELVDYGALSPADPQASEWVFSAVCVTRLRTAARLCNDLELETPVLALAISFLERIERLEEEVRALRAELGKNARR
jgi:chaperone modulatory protein CbpM